MYRDWVLSEGSELCGVPAESENERSPLVLQLDFGPVSLMVPSAERRDVDGRCRCKRSEKYS